VSWREHVRGVEIAPSLYAADFMRLGDQIEALLEAGCRIFHVDVGDGHFIPPVTIGPIVVESIAPTVHAAGGYLDCHLMVDEPERHFEQFRDAGGDSVTFHVEACSDVPAAIAHARDLGLGTGVAFNPHTEVEDAVAAARGADLLLCMSVVPGYSGQAFIPESLERIERLRSLAGGALVQVDGGVKESNAADVCRCGADVLVVGSGIFAGNDAGAAYTRVVRAVS
jgi:ribulose-phosphate 3-epimerase